MTFTRALRRRNPIAYRQVMAELEFVARRLRAPAIAPSTRISLLRYADHLLDQLLDLEPRLRQRRAA